MVKIDEAVIARITKNGHKFEVLVDPYLAMDVKHGKTVDFSELLADDKIFKDSSKGDLAAPETIKESFNTDEVNAVTKKIIEDGEVQLTTAQRKEFLERKEAEIVSIISKNAINPQTKTPHPPARIRNAMEQAKVHVDAFKSNEEQIKIIVNAIKRIIPVSMENVKFAVKIPGTHAPKVSGILHKYDIKKEQWLNDGSLAAEFELPVGLKQELISSLNSATHGDIILKEL
jgi:ribosome maturation protein SDO1